MPVTIEEFAKITDVNGLTHEGKVTATNLVEIETEEGGRFYGIALSLTKVRTTIVCDAGEHCENSVVNGEFKTEPKLIQFYDNGDNTAEFIKDIADVVITSDYAGKKTVFCSKRCAATSLKKPANVIEFPSGKGKRTFEESPAFIGGEEVGE